MPPPTTNPTPYTLRGALRGSCLSHPTPHPSPFLFSSSITSTNASFYPSAFLQHWCQGTRGIGSPASRRSPRHRFPTPQATNRATNQTPNMELVRQCALAAHTGQLGGEKQQLHAPTAHTPSTYCTRPQQQDHPTPHTTTPDSLPSTALLCARGGNTWWGGSTRCPVLGHALPTAYKTHTITARHTHTERASPHSTRTATLVSVT